ncbi:MAG: type IV toxin-antitoxin system AbiEi family antitoxin domain-containing protein [Bacteroidota bacterium]
MVFEAFRKEFIDQICFTSNQVYAWHPGFDKNTLSRWVKKGYLLKLRNNLYTFSELKNVNNIHYYIANRIYRPSYLSLHKALSFHGLIPESIVQSTSVSTMKTARFKNELGSFSYKKIKNELFFGYTQLEFTKDKTFLIALPEKALLDLLYLYPFYNNETEITNLRIDQQILSEVMQFSRLHEFLSRFKNKSLEKRMNLFLKYYST